MFGRHDNIFSDWMSKSQKGLITFRSNHVRSKFFFCRNYWRRRIFLRQASESIIKWIYDFAKLSNGSAELPHYSEMAKQVVLWSAWCSCDWKVPRSSPAATNHFLIIHRFRICARKSEPVLLNVEFGQHGGRVRTCHWIAATYLTRWGVA